MRIPRISQINSFKTIRKTLTGMAIGVSTVGLQSCGELIYVTPAPVYRPAPTVVIPYTPVYYYRPGPVPAPQNRHYHPQHPSRHHR